MAQKSKKVNLKDNPNSVIYGDNHEKNFADVVSISLKIPASTIIEISKLINKDDSDIHDSLADFLLARENFAIFHQRGDRFFDKDDFVKYCKLNHTKLFEKDSNGKKRFDFWFDVFTRKNNICSFKLIDEYYDEKEKKIKYVMNDLSVCMDKARFSPFIDLGFVEHKKATAHKRRHDCALHYFQKIQLGCLYELWKRQPDLVYVNDDILRFFGLKKSFIARMVREGVLVKIKHDEDTLGCMTEKLSYGDNLLYPSANKRITIGFKLAFLKDVKLGNLTVNEKALDDIAYFIYNKRKNVSRDDVLNLRKYGIAEKEYFENKQLGFEQKTVKEYEALARKKKKALRKDKYFKKEPIGKNFNAVWLDKINLYNAISLCNTPSRNNRRYGFNKTAYVVDSCSRVGYAWIAEKQLDAKQMSRFSHERKQERLEKLLFRGIPSRRELAN